MNANFKSVIPRAARKLSTASITSNPPPNVAFLFFDVQSPAHSQPQPRIITTALTTTNVATSKAPSKSTSAHPRYATNSSHPAPQSFPPVFFIPPSPSPPAFLKGSYNSEFAQSQESRSCKLEMGAYGIPKRRKPHKSADSSQLSGSRSESIQSSPSGSKPLLPRDDPAVYNLAVQVGEDAYFTRPNALGVADGVGGWRHSKHFTGESHSALLAKKLMHFCSLELAEGSLSPDSQSASSASSAPTQSSRVTPSVSASPASHPTSPRSTSTPLPDPDPVHILQHSYEKCIADARAAGHVTGSTTALVAVLVDNELRIAHLGDCSLALVRDGEMVYRSEEMQHSFNFPFQVGPASPTTPITHAQKITIPVMPGDILILATDGMGDNLWDEDVLDEVRRFVNSSGPQVDPSARHPSASRTPGPVTNGVLAQRLSEALASRAKRISERTSQEKDKPSATASEPNDTKPRNPTIAVGAVSEAEAREARDAASRLGKAPPASNPESDNVEEEPEYVLDEVPFGRKAREAGFQFEGGKNDDISVLVAIISGSVGDPATSNGLHPQLNLHLDRSTFR